MEKSNQNEEKQNSLNKLKSNIDKTLNKGQEIATTTKEGVQSIVKVTDNIKNTFGKTNNFVEKVTGLKDTFIESKKIAARTEVELNKIRSNHANVNRIISEEYGKQKQQMDKASDVVDKGLETNDINKIREGLSAMTSVANHNPMEKIKKELDEELERNLKQDFDDDFLLEF